MVKFHVLHHRRWRRPLNHLDGRVCPDCGASAHGWEGQNAHAAWHEQIDDVLVKLCQRTGIKEEEVELPWTWTAVVEPGEDEDEPGQIGSGS